MGLFRQPLLNPRLLAKQLTIQPIPHDHAQLLHGWATQIRSGTIARQRETAIRRPFLDMLFVQVLGYRSYGQGAEWHIHDEQNAARGSMDTALGVFSDDTSRVIAPFELKGPDTGNLDAIMPGRWRGFSF